MAGWQFATFGSCGGALVEVLSLLYWVGQWQEARRTASGRIKRNTPAWSTYVDWKVHTALIILRGGLGACAAALFGVTGQISGAYVAVALGFAAPSVLAQLGGIPQIAAAVNQTSTADSTRSDNATTGLSEHAVDSTAKRGADRTADER